MKALRKLSQGPGQVDIVEVDPPCPEEGEVLVRVQCAGICRTDIHILHGLFPKLRPPVTMGHEFCGTVAETGLGVKEWRVGDRVTVESAADFCRKCKYCRSGETQRCKRRLAFGYARDGAFATFVAARQDALHRLPDHVSFQEGALCEPLACATHAVMERSSLDAGMTALVTGPGPIGLLVLQVAKAMGATVIITGTERDEERLESASKLGADYWVRTDQSETGSFVHNITQGEGVDVAYECAGSVRALEDCMQCVRKGGEIVQVGLFGGRQELNYDDLTFREIQIKGAFTHNRGSWEKAIDLLGDRRVDLRPLISGEFPLNRWEEAFGLFEKGIGVKYVLYPIEETHEPGILSE